MDMSNIFMNDVAELCGKDFYYSRRMAKGDFNVIKAHAHEHYELYYLTEGCRRFFVKNKFYTINAGDVVFIKPGTIHFTAAETGCGHERILLNFTDKYISSTIKGKIINMFDGIYLTVPTEERNTIHGYFERISSEYKTNDAYSSFLEGEILSELLVAFLRIKHKETQSLTPKNISDGPIPRLLDFINENISAKITLDDAASYVGFSKSHFSRVFKEFTGFRFIDYLQLQRLLKARHLLEKTQDSVTSIAYDCGFANSGYFSTAFGKYFGMTPLEYRKNKADFRSIKALSTQTNTKKLK